LRGVSALLGPGMSWGGHFICTRSSSLPNNRLARSTSPHNTNTMRILTAIPVYNEANHVRDVLAAARRYSPEILVVNDGSTDGTAELLAREPNLLRVDHPTNRGYGAALI